MHYETPAERLEREQRGTVRAMRGIVPAGALAIAGFLIASTGRGWVADAGAVLAVVGIVLGLATAARTALAILRNTQGRP